MSKDLLFDPNKTYVILGTKEFDDGSILHVNRCSGKEVAAALEAHFAENPLSDAIEVLEVVGAFKPKITAERVP
jgi:hypothetical protein